MRKSTFNCNVSILWFCVHWWMMNQESIYGIGGLNFKNYTGKNRKSYLFSNARSVNSLYKKFCIITEVFSNSIYNPCSHRVDSKKCLLLNTQYIFHVTAYQRGVCLIISHADNDQRIPRLHTCINLHIITTFQRC